MLDLKISGGTIVDGTGRAGFRGDVGVRDGRIVAVGEVTEAARETIDATGRIVSPGFIDIHTHYDAQVFWDPTLSPSCYHGVTTVMAGFCGFTLAPTAADSASYIKPMLARVEGMPLATLDATLPLSWSSFGEFLGEIDGKVGLNVGFFAGHSTIRRVVMGERAVGEKATPQDLEKMKALLGKSLADGALGFSTSLTPTHNDGAGDPIPSRWAEHSELIELARVVKDYPGTSLEMTPEPDINRQELMTEMSLAAHRALYWILLEVRAAPNAQELVDNALSITDYARARGGEVIVATLPGAVILYMNLRSGFIFDAFPGLWMEVFKWPLEERMKRFKDPSVRRQLAADIATVAESSVMAPLARFEKYVVNSVKSQTNKKYEGRTLGDIAAQERRDLINVMLDIALADHLDTVFMLDKGGSDQSTYALRGKVWADDRALIGAGDAGAHVDLLDTFAFSSTVLEIGVRKYQVISLEQAVHNMTQRPAAYFGLIDRGVLATGYHADVVVFDADTVARGPVYQRFDLPNSNEFRLYADGEGIDCVIVNGAPIVRHGKHTGKLPGTVLRSGRDTQTVPLDAMHRKSMRESSSR